MFDMAWLIILICFLFVIVLIATILHFAFFKNNDASNNFNFDLSEKRCDRRGAQEENFTNHYLDYLLLEDEYLLTNLLLPLRNGYTTEVDSVLITRKGIFCIEIKKWVGHISGNDQDDYWIQKYDNPYRKDRRHRNPVKQNENHCLTLKRLLGNCFEIKNIVIFPKIEDGRYLDSAFVYELNEFVRYYKNLLNNETSEEDLKEIANRLKNIKPLLRS